MRTALAFTVPILTGRLPVNNTLSLTSFASHRMFTMLYGTFETYTSCPMAVAGGTSVTAAWVTFVRLNTKTFAFLLATPAVPESTTTVTVEILAVSS